jgi:hypothetical protein
MIHREFLNLIGPIDSQEGLFHATLNKLYRNTELSHRQLVFLIVALCQHISLMVEHLEDALLCILPQKCESLAAVMEHPALHLFRTFSYPF